MASNDSSIRHGPLTLPLPDGWFDASQVVAMGPEDGGFRTSMVVSLEPVHPGESAQQFAARMLPQVQKVAPGFSLVAEKDATYGDKEGVLREHTFTVEGLRVAQLQFLTVKNGVGYTFTYTQRADRLARTRAVAEQLFVSAKLGTEPLAPRLSRIRG